MTSSFVSTNYDDYIDEFIKINNLRNGRSSGYFDNTYYYDSPNGEIYGVCYLDGNIWKVQDKKFKDSF